MALDRRTIRARRRAARFQRVEISHRFARLVLIESTVVAYNAALARCDEMLAYIAGRRI